MRLDLHQGLRVSCGEVTLKAPTVSEALAAADLVAGGLFAEGDRVTLADWYHPDDLVRTARGSISYLLDSWTGMAASRELPFVIVVDGTVVGAQGLHVNAPFVITREVSTGSWVGRHHRGAGFGTLARWCALEIAFEGLHALTVRSEAFIENHASQRVSQKCGYQPDGTAVCAQATTGQRMVMRRFRHDRERWRALARPLVRAEGLDEIAAFTSGD